MLIYNKGFLPWNVVAIEGQQRSDPRMTLKFLLGSSILKKESTKVDLCQMGLVNVESIYLFYCKSFVTLQLESLPNNCKSTFSSLFLFHKPLNEVIFDSFILFWLHYLKWASIKRPIFWLKVKHLVWFFLWRSAVSQVSLVLFLPNVGSLIILPFYRVEGKHYFTTPAWILVGFLDSIRSDIDLRQLTIWPLRSVF